jgi:signal transduction histidine kinase
MTLIIFLIVSIILQFLAAALAISLVKKTKYNVSWILLSLALTGMAARRTLELFQTIDFDVEITMKDANTWLGIFNSICISVGLILVRKIFKFIGESEIQRIQNERKILKAVVLNEEKNKKEFAKNLHDELGPLLSAMKMAVSSLQDARKNDKERKTIENIELLIAESLKSVKTISNKVSPHVLSDFGLHTAIKHFSDKISGEQIPVIQFRSNIENVRFPAEAELILFRAVCELISNTLQHAEAKNIQIEIYFSDHELTIAYSDDGIGADIMAIDKFENSGLGHYNIISGIRLLGGTIKFESEPGKGLSAGIKIKLQSC